MRRRFAYGLMLLLSILSAGTGQSFNNAGSVGMQFLKIGVGARAGGMGGAAGSLTGDESLLTVNPAAIGTIDRLTMSVHHTQWVEQTELNFIGVVLPVSDQVNLAFQTTYLTTGSIEMTTIDVPEGTGEFYDAADIAVGLTASVRPTSQLTFAGTVKYVQERIYDVSTDGIAVDAGMHYATGYRSLAVGFSVMNLGFEQRFTGRPLDVQYVPADPSEPEVRAELQTERFALPLSFRASGSFDLLEMFMERNEEHQTLVLIDFIQNADTRERVILGAEYRYDGTLFIRGGHVFNADVLGWSAGAGVALPVSGNGIRFDLSASSLGRFGIHYRVGVAVSANVR